ncbi:uncharacterized protein FOMMEDRAFT_156089 [Fomitiporia mediterranea MF3/22]|uniref:uncharacterized protein n=1 Tax=Fomitiporia mediterranea (strain MF3/22) TaxID=694068 RepID=UPI0004407A61|nr:uncharacterized protein FOMMEDRAFT_156089 [Fomitiporia mediterranea MF3/22]EJD02756.1 hypothetical protein FOMMEDRAFT_156089 [Fomitiporia mediterranea MF3/22]
MESLPVVGPRLPGRPLVEVVQTGQIKPTPMQSHHKPHNSLNNAAKCASYTAVV